MRNLTRWVLGICGTVIVLGVAWLLGPRLGTALGKSAKDPMALLPPVRSLTFGDGSRFEVFGLAEDEWVDGIHTAPAGKWQAHVSNSSTHGLGPDKDLLQVQRFRLNGKLAGVRLWIREGCLMMSLRLLDSHGYPVPAGDLRTEGFEIHLSDGAGEWIRGYGPHGADDDPEMRAVAIFEGWPRSGAELVFKAVLKGSPPVEFRLPNPAAGRTPEAWTAGTLPQKRSGDHWDLELKEVREVLVHGQGRALQPIFEFDNRLPKPPNGWNPIDGYPGGIKGTRGTLSSQPLVCRGEDGDLQFVFPAPPDEGQFKILFEIKYRETYPFSRAGAVIIAEGTVGGDGELTELSSRNLDLGILSIEVGRLREKKIKEGQKGFAIHFDGVWRDVHERRSAEARLGPWKDWQCVVFLDGGDVSAGSANLHDTRISDGFGSSKKEFQWNGEWTGEITPGMKAEIGVMPRKPDDVLEFVIDRSSLSPITGVKLDSD